MRNSLLRYISIISIFVVLIIAFNIFISCVNAASPTIQWDKPYGGKGIQQTSDSGYIFLSGSSLIKTDSSGDISWEKPLEYSFVNAVRQTIDGGYIITGYNGDWDTPGEGMFLLKTDSNGETQWVKTYSDNLRVIGETSDSDPSGWWANSVQQTSDGGYIITGQSSYIYESFYLVVVKTDSDGNIEWYKLYGGYDDCRGFSAIQTTDGGYIVSGTYNFQIIWLK